MGKCNVRHLLQVSEHHLGDQWEVQEKPNVEVLTLVHAYANLRLDPILAIEVGLLVRRLKVVRKYEAKQRMELASQILL